MTSKTDQWSNEIPPSISRNIETIEDYYRRDEQRVGRARRLLERLGAAVGRPLFLASIVSFVATWILINVIRLKMGLKPFDPPPYSALQGLLSLAALLTTTIVLIGQNRLAELERRRDRLELQVNILTEQKTTKLIHLLEELRHDLPMVRDRHDPDASRLQQPTDATRILTALEGMQTSDEVPGRLR